MVTRLAHNLLTPVRGRASFVFMRSSKAHPAENVVPKWEQVSQWQVIEPLACCRRKRNTASLTPSSTLRNTSALAIITARANASSGNGWERALSFWDYRAGYPITSHSVHIYWQFYWQCCPSRYGNPSAYACDGRAKSGQTSFFHRIGLRLDRHEYLAPAGR